MPLRRSLNKVRAAYGKVMTIACDTYRPELHYMRGPGPKWHARHGIDQERSTFPTRDLWSIATTALTR
ncbi:hypothetical protein AC630_23610 [Bradyrhizobium sp. AS23.2]|nr:hypothetical protein AC630_23610 [Bradyrhizobium sp. AS23.2]